MNDNIKIRPMLETDYDKVHELWMSIHRFGMHSVDDSRDGIIRFINRNKGISVVAESEGKLVGSILCGHDGRTGGFYHVCVREEYRRQGIGSAMVRECVSALKRESITKISLFSFINNSLGNPFWNKLGFVKREDVNNYEWQLDTSDTLTFNE